MSKPVRAQLCAAAAFALSMLAGTAHAAFYSSHFDPLGPVTFEGDGIFEISDACLLADNTYTGAQCNARLVSATLDLTDTNSGDSGHVVFGGSTAIFDIIVFNGQLAGVDSDLIGAAFPATCTGIVCGTPWWLQWSTQDFDPVFLYTGSCYGDIENVARIAGNGRCSPNDEPSGTAFHVTFARIPEPGTLALLFGGLAAGWATRRRNRRQD